MTNELIFEGDTIFLLVLYKMYHRNKTLAVKKFSRLKTGPVYIIKLDEMTDTF